jgi:hypothetical protein
MTTNSIGPTFATSDPLLYLLAQRVEVERENQRHDDSVRVAAHEARLAADRAAEKAMHEKADAIRTGAWVQLGVTAAGTGAQAAGVATRSSGTDSAGRAASGSSGSCKLSAYLTGGGAGASSSAEPVGRLFGDAPAAHADARASGAKSRADSAQAQYDAVQSAKQKSEKHLDAMFDQVQRIMGLVRQGLEHVLGKF